MDGLLGGGGLLPLPLPPSLPQGRPSRPMGLTTQVHSCLVMTQGARMLDCSTGTLLGCDENTKFCLHV